ncbi:MAG: hypothetical protein HYX69_11940 [Planctomycetia bacterium]|nr:hypothetical protein [Planctomycetia bacterium]
MLAAFYLLTIVGLVGSIDVLFYHIYKLRLYRQREAMWENLTHLTRALLFGVMMLTVIHLRASGWLWFIYPLLLGFELTNTMIDVTMEPYTRRNLGGLPPVEYILHVFLSICTGAALASVVWGTYTMIWEPTGIAIATVPVGSMVLLGAYWAVLVSFGMFTFELVGFLRLFRTRHNQTPTSRPETVTLTDRKTAKEALVR